MNYNRKRTTLKTRAAVTTAGERSREALEVMMPTAWIRFFVTADIMRELRLAAEENNLYLSDIVKEAIEVYLHIRKLQSISQ